MSFFFDKVIYAMYSTIMYVIPRYIEMNKVMPNQFPGLESHEIGTRGFWTWILNSKPDVVEELKIISRRVVSGRVFMLFPDDRELLQKTYETYAFEYRDWISKKAKNTWAKRRMAKKV